MAVQLTQEMIQGAQQTERLTGVPSSITLSQIILESSGKYEGGLSYLAYKGNNLFGVKSFSDSDEKIYVRNSDGLVAWKKYDSQYDSIVDHARILQLDRYKSRYKNASSVSDYAQALQDGGYAGNSTTYANQLVSLIDNYNLNQYNLNNSTLNNDTGIEIQDSIDSGSSDFNASGSSDLSIIGNIIKYIAIVLLSIISVFFILKSIGIDLKG